MKITKKQIAEKTTTTRGEGWNPYYKYWCEIEAQDKKYIFEKPFDHDLVFVMWNGWNELENQCAGIALTKKEFINNVYDYLESL